MKKILKQQFVQNNEGLFIIHNKFAFWEFFKILRKYNYEAEMALNFIFANCSLSALVFEECIFNGRYKKLNLRAFNILRK